MSNPFDKIGRSPASTGSSAATTPPRHKHRRAILLGVPILLAAIGVVSFVARPSAPQTADRELAATVPSASSSSPTADVGIVNEITPSPEVTAPPVYVPAPETATPVIEDLNSLRVRGRAPRAGYAREFFGPAWADVDANGCDTRDDVLRASLTGAIVEGDCSVVAGGFTDPYTATAVTYESGPAMISIDHVVALSDAWQTGAQTWPIAKRVAFANDPLELQATVREANQQKGDSDAASWLPPNRAHWCPFVAQQVAVKIKYDLWVTPAEKDAMMRVLTTCPGQMLPKPGAQPTMAVGPVAQQSTSTRVDAPPTDSTSGAGGALDPDFGTCRKAKSAGFGPYVSGIDPEYAFYRDADHDGTVCE